MSPNAAPSRGRVRLLRWAALGGSSMALAAAAHLIGGGRLPGVGVLTLAGALVGLVALTATVRRLRFPVLLGVLGAEQLGLHYLFSVASTLSPVGCVMTHGVATHQAVSVGGAGVLSCALAPGGAAPAMTSGSTADALMLAGHVLATLATAWVLARGEAWLWRLTERVIVAAAAAPCRRPRSWLHLSSFDLPEVAALRRALSPGAPRAPPVRASLTSSA